MTMVFSKGVANFKFEIRDGDSDDACYQQIKVSLDSENESLGS